MYIHTVGKVSANFALCSDFAMAMGGKLKFAEFTSGRFADVLSNIYLGYAVLWHARKNPIADQKHVVDMAMQTILCDIEDAFDGIFSNFPVPMLGGIMRALTFPLGRTYYRPADATIAGAAESITTMTSVRELLHKDLFMSKDPSDRVNLILSTLPKAIEADKIYASMRQERRQATASEQLLLDEVVSPALSCHVTHLTLSLNPPLTHTHSLLLLHTHTHTCRWRLLATSSSKWILSPDWAQKCTSLRSGQLPIVLPITHTPQ